ncbi:MAG: hypothetical protein I8H80_01405, partial [Alphaproteobacteria bacterium]|nr:hypothetical protein [Alphaproteobacteria bacterium]
AKVEGAKAEWFNKDSADYATLKSNQRQYLLQAEMIRQKKAWDIEEATYSVDTPEWCEFKAKVEGAKAEWYDIDSENYATLKFNQGIYLKRAECIRQQNAWDIEEAAYAVDTPEWCEFKAKVEGAKAEWYDRDSENYATLKSNQKVYLLQAEMIRRSREEGEAESDTESENDVEPLRHHQVSFWPRHSSIPMGAAPSLVRVFESLPRLQTAAQTEAQRLFDEGLAMMDRLDDLDAELGASLPRQATEVAAETQRQPQTSDLTSPIPAELPLVEELEAPLRIQEEAESAAEAQRQDRISVGRSLMADPGYLSVVRLVATIFVSAEFAGLALTPDDQAEIMFYIPHEIKDRMYLLETLLPEVFLTGEVISRIREKDWSAFSEIIVDFDAEGDDSEDGEQHTYATPEIEDFLQSTLKNELKAYLRLLAEDESISEDLKGWLNTEMESLIDQQLLDIYRNYDAHQLNEARQTLLGTSLSYVSEVSFRSHNSERLAEALRDSRWEDVSDSVYVITRCITDAKIQGKWSKIYDSTRDLDPKRAFDPNAPFTDREESQVAALIQGISREAAMVTTLECIFLKERAKALFNRVMGLEDEDE